MFTVSNTFFNSSIKPTIIAPTFSPLSTIFCDIKEYNTCKSLRPIGVKEGEQLIKYAP